MTLSKAYKHGTQWRYRTKTESGWKWCGSADSPQAAVLAAQKHGETVDSIPPSQDGIPSSQEGILARQDTPSDEGPPTHDASGPSGVRITGPYDHDGGFRCRIISSIGREWAPMGRTRAQALKLAEDMAAAATKHGSVTIRDSIDAFVEHKRVAGAPAATLEGTRRGLQLYWSGMLDLTAGRITAGRAQQQYDQLRQMVDSRRGRGQLLSVDTTRSYLKQAKMWARWAVKRGWLRGPSPLAEIQGVGRRKRGKPQLTRGELGRLITTCAEVAARGDEGALAVLIAVCLGLRASEILSRTVRDIDIAQDPDTGEDVPVLRVCDNSEQAFQLKTGDSARSPEIPPILQPLLASWTSGKEPGDPLFPGTLGGRRRRQWLWVEVRRLCGLASVPIISPHSLRGTLATGAAASGVRLDLISAVLGHNSSIVTRQHYIKPGTIEQAQRERGLQALTRQPAALPS